MGLKSFITGLGQLIWNGKSGNRQVISDATNNCVIAKDMIFKAFSEAKMPMTINNLESGRYVDANEAFLKALGYKRDEIIGRTSGDIQVFTDIEDSKKYAMLLSKFQKVTDFQIKLRKKNGENKPLIFSAETMKLGNEVYLLTTYTEPDDLKNKVLNSGSSSIINEIFETISNYLALFNVSSNGDIIVKDLNHKVEEIEQVNRAEIINKNVNETKLAEKASLMKLLNHLKLTGTASKVSVSGEGDDLLGSYIGFMLSNGDFVISWEPGQFERLKESEIFKQGSVFEKFADTLPELIFELDLKGRVTYANLHGLRYFGYTEEDLKKDITIAELFPPEELKKAFENLEKIKDIGITSNNKYSAWKKDKTLIPIFVKTFGVFHQGKLTGYRGVVTDISEQKKYENEIIKEKAFLEHIIDSTPEAIVITDIPGKITLINQEFTNLFGYTKEEAIDKYIDDLVVPDEFKEEAIMIDDLALQNSKEVRQIIRQDKSGQRIHVSLIASTISINEVTVAHLGIYRDNRAERKNELIQEILFNISTAALKQFDIKDIYPTIVSELSKIWDTNNFYIALWDKVNNTISLPFFADEKDDFKEISAKGTITAWVIRNNRSVLLKEDDIKKMEDAGEVDMVGTPCKVWMGVPLKVDNEIIGIMCLQDYYSEDKFSTDDLNVLDFIANQVATAIQRRTMLDNMILAKQKAEEAAQSKQIFMSTMSHEIRTPLNEVIGIANLLMQGNPREDQMDLIKTLRFSGNHLMSLVNDVLDYNKIESGKIVFEQTQFNLNDFLNDMKRSYSFRAQEKKLDFDIIKNGNLPISIIGDPIRLNQILSNLLSNALKFTLSGGISVNVVEIARTGNQSNIEFRISDTGIGISKEKHEDIFESFTQASTDTTRRFGGTGLGLAISKKLIELQGGTITVESEPEKGSTFIFNLIVTVASEQSAASTSTASETFGALEGKKILVAEDNKINFFVANKFLLGWGMIVSHAENGQLALEMIEKEDFDMILMDLHMPIMDGIEATRIIRTSSNAKIKNIPIIALTAAIMSESHDKIEDLNINDYVLKPFKPQDLYDRILKHIK